MDIDSAKRQIRLIVLLNAAEKAGLAPMPLMRLHAFGYFANVLSPLWELEPLDGKILKKRGGPFYPTLQRDLDRMVGTGLIIVSGVQHKKNSEGHWRLEGNYRLNGMFKKEILNCLNNYEEEVKLQIFIQEIAYAISSIDDNELDQAMLEDATYMDPVNGEGNVIDFGEWKDVNYSANSAQSFDFVMPYPGSPGRKLHLYFRHLYRRAHGG